MNINLCSVKGCNEARHISSTGKIKHRCLPHLREQSNEWYAARPGYKATENLRYFTRNEGRLTMTSGYWHQMGIQHPASNPSGLTPLHRIILWDKLDGEDVPCAECGGQLIWFSGNTANELCVDHIDGNKMNNDPNNLDPVHGRCNTIRAHRMRAKAKAVSANV